MDLYECERCARTFDKEIKLIHHQIQKCKNKKCLNCKAIFSSVRKLEQHLKKRRDITCDHCARTFCNNEHFQQHRRSIRSISRNQNIPDLDQEISPASGYEDYDDYQDLIDEKIAEIGDRRKKTRNYEIINQQIDFSFTYRDLNDILLDIYSTHQNAFKIC